MAGRVLLENTETYKRTLNSDNKRPSSKSLQLKSQYNADQFGHHQRTNDRHEKNEAQLAPSHNTKSVNRIPAIQIDHRIYGLHSVRVFFHLLFADRQLAPSNSLT